MATIGKIYTIDEVVAAVHELAYSDMKQPYCLGTYVLVMKWLRALGPENYEEVKWRLEIMESTEGVELINRTLKRFKMDKYTGGV